jgi:hypothetical protein
MTLNRTAYLVAHLDTATSPPVVKGVGIYSEPARSLTMIRGMFAVDVYDEWGTDYEDAIRNLLKSIRLYPSIFAWVKPLMRDRDWPEGEQSEERA